MTQEIINALIAKYNADILIARTNLQNYLTHSVGVGGHPDIIKECDKLFSKISAAEGKVESIKNYVDSMKQLNPITSGNESSNNRK